jgi:hypothetical protein
VQAAKRCEGQRRRLGVQRVDEGTSLGYAGVRVALRVSVGKVAGRQQGGPQRVRGVGQRSPAAVPKLGQNRVCEESSGHCWCAPRPALAGIDERHEAREPGIEALVGKGVAFLGERAHQRGPHRHAGEDAPRGGQGLAEHAVEPTERECGFCLRGGACVMGHGGVDAIARVQSHEPILSKLRENRQIAQ